MQVSNAGGGLGDVYILPESANTASTGGLPAASTRLHKPTGRQPGRGRRLMQNIVGSDDRVETEMLAHIVPLSAVGMIKFGSHRCSGALVGPRTVLTASHCLYDIGTKKWNNPWYV